MLKDQFIKGLSISMHIIAYLLVAFRVLRASLILAALEGSAVTSANSTELGMR